MSAPILSCLHVGGGRPALHAAADALAAQRIESMPVHTCQRCELYVISETWMEPPSDVTLLATQTDAAARLYQLAAGGLSDVPGERAVDEQLRRAERAAADRGWSGRRLQTLSRHARRFAARARQRIEQTVPILELPDLVARYVLAAGPFERGVIVGQGRLARRTAEALSRAGRPVQIVQFASPGGHDLLITARAGAAGIIDRSDLPTTATVIDLAVPRNVQGDAITLDDVLAARAADLRPQTEALQRAVHRLPSIASAALARVLAPPIGPIARSVSGYRTAIVDAELARLEPVLADLPEDVAQRVRRTIRHTAARCMHPLHECVNQLGRQGRIDEAQTFVDHLLGGAIGWSAAPRPAAQEIEQ